MNRGALFGTFACLFISFPIAAEEQVTTAAAELVTIPREVWLDGNVEAVNQSTISAQTGGEVQQVLFDVDDYVEKGKLIVRLKDTEQKAQLIKAEGAMNEVEARLKETKDKHARIKGVFSKKLVSQADMDGATAELKAAEARFSSAKAGLEQAREQLGYTNISAPYSGIVTRRHIQVGEIAQPGKPLMTGISLDLLRVLVDVPQSVVTAVRRLGKAWIKLPAIGTVTATRITVFPFADHTSNTFKVRIDLPRDVPGLFPGMFVKTAFALGEREVLAIPENAIVHRGEVTGVYVVNEAGRISFRHIRPGNRLPGGLITVLAGLDKGEKVALDPIGAGVILKRQPQAMVVGNGD